MAGIHEKATKWLQENRKQLKHMMDHQRKNLNSKPSQDKKSEAYKCSYCPKAFFEAEYLVKHIFRRHSEKLLLLHKHVLDSTNSENNSPLDLIKYIRTEFTDLKGELKEVRQVVSELVSKNSSIQEQNPLKVSNTDVTNDVKSADSIPDCATHMECSPGEVEPLDLESKVHSLFEKYKNDVILNEVRSITIATKGEVCEELKNYLQSELQNMLLYHLDKNSSEWKTHVSKLQRDVSQLAERVTSNTKKLDSSEALQMLEKKFEQQLQIFLNTDSSNAKKNFTKPKITQGRKKKGLYTLNSQALNTTSEITELHKSDISRCDKVEEKKLRKASHSKINSEKSSAEKKKKLFLGSEVNYIIDEKLRSLNINPLVQELSSEEYEKKIYLLKTEKEIQNNSAAHVLEMRNKLDSYVDDLAKSRLKAKCPKKLRFSDSFVLHSTLREEKNSELSINSGGREVIRSMSPVEYAEDCYAHGDCRVSTRKDPETPNTIPVPDAEKCTSELVKNDLSHVGQKCDSSLLKTSAAETFNKSLESVEHFNSVSGHPSHEVEELSELSSLSDLDI